MYTKRDALLDIFEIENVADKLSKAKFRNVTFDALLQGMSKSTYTLSTELEVSPATAVSVVRYLFPDKPKDNSKVCGFLLTKYGYKSCSKCTEIKLIEDFSKNASKPSGYNTYCKQCYTVSTRDYQREYQKTRKALKLARVPSWADLGKIQEIYSNCPVGYHVDHIVPLQGKLVSGLHVENNLQYLRAEENLKKSNKYEIG